MRYPMHRRPFTAMPAGMVDAREAWREAAVAHLQTHHDESDGIDAVTRFHQAFSATMYNLDCLVEKLNNLREIEDGRADGVRGAFFYVVMYTDEFFRHFFSVRENLIQEINFVFGPREDWLDQDSGLERRVREHLDEPDWWAAIDVRDEDWWGRAKTFRHHFEHRHIPTYMRIRRDGGDLPGRASADEYLTLLDPDGTTEYVPLLDELWNLRAELRDYCQKVAEVLTAQVEVEEE